MGSQAQVEKWRSKVQEIVRPYGIKDVVDLADGNAALKQLRDDNQELQQALTTLENAEDRADQAEERIGAIDEKIKDIFDQLDLPVGDDEAVQKCCNRYEDYEEAEGKARDTEQKVELEEERLRSEEGFEEPMLSLEPI